MTRDLVTSIHRTTYHVNSCSTAPPSTLQRMLTCFDMCVLVEGALYILSHHDHKYFIISQRLKSTQCLLLSSSLTSLTRPLVKSDDHYLRSYCSGRFLHSPIPDFRQKSYKTNYTTKTKSNTMNCAERQRAESCGMEAKHALVLTFPGQGTFNAVLDFSKVLSARGFIVTFVNTEHMHRRLFESPTHEEAAVESLRRQGLRISFKCIPDGLPPDCDHASNLAEVSRALQRWGPALESLAATLEEEGLPITCVVSIFSVYSSARNLALKLGVPKVVFWPFCVGASVAQSHTRILISKGHLPHKGEDDLITCLPPGFPPVLRSSDLIVSHTDQEFFQSVLYETDFLADADCVVVNSFEELEGPDIVRGLSVNCPSLTVGPVFLHQKTEIRRSMWEEDAECLRWLDGQKPGSVLYVSFGSIAALSIDQLHELALGLEASQQPFLWSLRSVGKSLDDLVPRGFSGRIRDRGLLVEWAPQRQVLAHGSVGGFLTHCGWNSTLESISAGVPMIGWPLLFDQFINCRFVTEVWKVGMSSKRITDGDEVVKREEVEELVRGLMEGEEGKVVRESAKRAGEAAQKSVMPGGSSSKNIDILLQVIGAKLRQWRIK